MSTLNHLISERTGAFVSYFLAEKSPDAVTGCLKLGWESNSRLYAVIDVSNIFRIVHIAPFYTGLEVDSDHFLLNKYLFR